MIRDSIFGHAYDNAGNQISRTVNNPDKSWTYSWDNENRLIRSEQSKGSEKKTATYTYDPMGRRINKTVTSVIKGVTRTTTWQYVYDGDNIALEILTKADGTTEKSWYTHGIGTDEHLAVERGGENFFYHSDGLGSITALTDSNRNIVQTYEYDSFGNVKPSTSFRNSYTYTGREYDPETGLHYYRARYYDANAGIFISKDPISFAGGDVNLYRYVQNNPIRYTDPTGMIVQVCKRDLNFPVIHDTQSINSILHHAFISVNGETFGLTTHNPSYNTKCGIEGPGAIDSNLGIDRAAEIEGFMHGSCKKVSCKNEKKLLEGIKRERFSPPHYCMKPGGGGTNCQQWAADMISKYCGCEE